MGGAFTVFGRSTRTPACRIGVTTMKMMSSTRQTSTSGVTLISLRTEAFCAGFRDMAHLRNRTVDRFRPGQSGTTFNGRRLYGDWTAWGGIRFRDGGGSPGGLHL